MHIQCVPVREVFRQEYFPQSFARAGPARAQCAEGRAQVDAGGKLGPVISLHIRRGKGSRQSFQVPPVSGCRQGRARRHATLHVQRPILFRAPAEDLDALRPALLGTIQHNLHRPAITALGVLLGKDQRAVQLQFLQHQCVFALGVSSQNGHGAVQCSRCHQSAKDLVVLQPRRIRRGDFSLEGNLAAGRFVPCAQQRVVGAGSAALGRIKPVAFALERIARQRNPVPHLSGEQTLERNLQASLVRVRGRINEVVFGFRRGTASSRATHARQRNRGLTGVPVRHRIGPRLQRHWAQHRVGAYFDYQVNPQFGKGSDATGKCHCFAGMAPPVHPVQRHVGFHRPARQIADQSERGRFDHHPVQGGFQSIQNRLQQGTVKSPARVQSDGTHSLRAESLRNGIDVLSQTTYHLVTAVVPRNAQPDSTGRGVQLRNRRRYTRRGREDGKHGAGRGIGKQSTSRRRQSHSVFQTEYPGRLGGRQFPNAVSKHHTGLNANTGPERGQCALQRIKGGLLPCRIAQVSLHSCATEHHVEQRCTSFFLDYRLASVQNGPCQRLTLIKRPAHAEPLASLSRIDEGHFLGPSWFHACACLSHCPESFPQGPNVVKHDSCTVVEMTAANTGRP